jgi:phosphoserine phosphatase
MDSVLVLIAAPGSGAINRTVTDLLAALGADEPHWLNPGEAAEVPFFSHVAEFVAALKGFPIDLATVSTENRHKRLLIADMDSTMIGQECIDELGAAAGLGERIRAITDRAMRGELDFEAALRERVGLLKGLDAEIIDRIIRERISYMPGGKTLIATMRARGSHTALVSGGFRQFTEKVAAHLGFDEHQANDLVIADGRLAGTVGDPILGEQAKVEALRRIALTRGLDPSDAIAVGDGANDVAMLTEAGMGVALHAKPHVQDTSLIRINHGDLTALLYLQGYHAKDFVRPV